MSEIAPKGWVSTAWLTVLLLMPVAFLKLSGPADAGQHEGVR